MGVMDTGQKVRENRIRNAARRQGLTLTRNRTRDPRALDFGTYRLTDDATGHLVAKPAAGEDISSEWDARAGRPTPRAMRQQSERIRLTLGDVEALLKGPRQLVPADLSAWGEPSLA